MDPDDKETQSSRRGFFGKASTAGAASAAPFRGAVLRPGSKSPSKRITLGMIGTGRRAWPANLRPFLAAPEAQVVAVRDVEGVTRHTSRVD